MSVVSKFSYNGRGIPVWFLLGNGVCVVALILFISILVGDPKSDYTFDIYFFIIFLSDSGFN